MNAFYLGSIGKDLVGGIMKDWEKVTVSRKTSLQNAIRTLDASGMQFIMVIEENGVLAGVLSDGDIRRAMLNSINLSIPVEEIMNTEPVIAGSALSKSEILTIMRKHTLHHIPILDSERKVVGLATVDQLVGFWERPNWVVLMAGGLGKRLRPLTDNCPKPMLPIDNKPILEWVLESFIEQGFRKFYFSVNYLADMIQNYFGDGSNYGVEIRYLNENIQLGTGGALSLIPEIPKEEMIVMNGDILTTMNFEQMVNFHQTHQAYATMAVREYDFQVPYGVINVDGIDIMNIDEKPKQKFLINAGIYTIHPDCLRYIPKDTFFDMPSLFKKLQQDAKPSVAYLLRERWTDIGRKEELELAQKIYSNIQDYEIML